MTRRAKREVAYAVAFLTGLVCGFVHGLRSEPEIQAEREFERIRDDGGWG